MMRLIFLSLAGALLLCGCASMPPVPGQSLANGSPRLRRDTVNAVAAYEMVLAPYKGPLRIVDTQIVQPPNKIDVERATDFVETKWTERWVIQRGTTNFAYRIYFDAQGSRGTDIQVGQDRQDLTNHPVDIIDIK